MIVIGIQARSKSKRLPGKIFYEINGMPMYKLISYRCKQAKMVDEVLFLPSINDNKFMKELEGSTESFYAADCEENDVIERYKQLFDDNENISHIVRITGDCPLIMPDLIDQVVSYSLQNNAFGTNVGNRTWPKGFDIECLPRNYFYSIYEITKLSVENVDLWSEHVTKCIYDLGLKIKPITNQEDMSSINVSVDTIEDYKRVKKIYTKYPLETLLYSKTAIECIKNECGFDEYTNGRPIKD